MASDGNLSYGDPSVVISLAYYRAQRRRRAAAAAAANACRRGLIAALLLGAGVLTGYTIHRDYHLPQLPAQIRR
jgi:hypothetical protein